MAMIYHLLDEKEPFSEKSGGAISRWAANTLRSGTEVVICPWADASWGFPVERVYQWESLRRVKRVHPLIYRVPWILQKLTLRPLFRKILEKLKPGDVIYVHNRPAYAAVLATIAPQHGIQVILHMHNSLLMRANKGQLAALRDTPIVFCSQFLQTEADTRLNSHFKKTFVVHNGADATKFSSSQTIRKTSPTVIYTGRLVPHKGIHVLLKAMRVLESDGVDVKCKVVGGAGFGTNKVSPYIKELRRLKPDNTELTGYLVGDALADVLRSADIFCCPSTWNDPFPLAPLEAMATGLPVVASNAGGFPEMLAFGGGILVPPNDVPALAQALRSLIEDRPYRQNMSQQALKSFNDNFLWSKVRDRYLQVVDGLLC